MRICACTVIKNEHEYLEDWLKYNIKLGVDKIFIVEDIGSVSHNNIVGKFPDNVVILDILFNESDFNKFHCRTHQLWYLTKMFKYIRALNEYDWCFIIDIDEYITLTEKITLKDFLSQYNDYSELILYWKNYGANGHIEKPDYSKVNSYREYYTKECGYSDMDSRCHIFMKKAVNLNKIPLSYHVSLHFHSMATYIKTNFQKGIHTPCYERAYLAHYITKSWEEYKWKLLTRGMCCKNHRKIDDFFEMNKDMLHLKDKCI